MPEEQENIQLNVDELRGCDCLTKIEVALVREYGEKFLGISLKEKICPLNFQTFTDLHPLAVRLREGGKTKTVYINFKFCPFCGRKK